MNIGEMHTALKLELDKSDSLNSISFEPEELDYWINKAIKRFVKTRYSGSNYKGAGFEQSQKRTDDLKSLVVFTTLNLTSNSGINNRLKNSYSATLPVNYWFSVAEECEIVFNPYLENILTPVNSGELIVGSYYMVVGATAVTHNSVSYSPGKYFSAVNTSYSTAVGSDSYVVKLDNKIEGVTQVDSDTYNRHINNSFSEHRLHYYSANPLRLFRNEGENNVVVLVSDGNYFVTKYYLTYIRQPRMVNSNPGVNQGSDLPNHTHDEIIDMAAMMMIENIESQRIQTQQAVSINE
jgi:hypothetical protein